MNLDDYDRAEESKEKENCGWKISLRIYLLYLYTYLLMCAFIVAIYLAIPITCIMETVSIQGRRLEIEQRTSKPKCRQPQYHEMRPYAELEKRAPWRE